MFISEERWNNKQIEMICILPILWPALAANCNDPLSTNAALYSLLKSGALAPAGSLLLEGICSAGKSGGLLSGAPGGTDLAVSPTATQPPGSAQFANACDPTDKKEAFKRCFAEQLEKLKNVVENCRKVLGEYAKECCIDGSCLDMINGKGCGTRGGWNDECEKKRRSEMMAANILENLDMQPLLTALMESIKSSVRKLGDRLLGCGAVCGEGDAATNAANTASGANGAPSGVLVVPADSGSFQNILSMLNTQSGGMQQTSGQASQQPTQASQQYAQPAQQQYTQPSQQYSQQPSQPAQQQPSQQYSQQPSQPAQQQPTQPSQPAQQQPSQPSQQYSQQYAQPAQQQPAQPNPQSQQTNTPSKQCSPRDCAESGRADAQLDDLDCERYCKDRKGKRKSKESCCKSKEECEDECSQETE
jgi:hypothetical protein